MQLNVSSNRVVIGSSLRDHIKRRLETALNRVSRSIQKASIHLAEVLY